MQRDRSPANYEDPEALYERRPSAWIEPVGSWGAGRVELVQIPTPDETNDNIVAYWVPQAAPVPGKPVDFAYRIRWQSAGTLPAGKAWVVQTRRGRGFAKRADGDINFVVDFDGPALRALAAGRSVEPVIWVDANAEVRERNLFRNPVSGAWRMTVRIKRNDAAKPVELRAYLKQQQTTLSETWSYILPAEADEAMTGAAAATCPQPPLAALARWPPGPGPGPLLRRPAAPPARPRPPRRARRRADDRRPLMPAPAAAARAGAARRLRRHPAMAEVLPKRGAALAEHGLLVLFGILFALDLGRLLDRRDGRRRVLLRGRGEAR